MCEYKIGFFYKSLIKHTIVHYLQHNIHASTVINYDTMGKADSATSSVTNRHLHYPTFSKFLSEDMATIISNAMYKDLYIEICTPYDNIYMTI